MGVFLLSANNVVFEKLKHGFSRKPTFMNEILVLLSLFLVFSIWVLVSDPCFIDLCSLQTAKIAELLRHQQRANSYFSSSGASACLNLNGNRKESLSDPTTWKARTPAMPPQSTQRFFARHCRSMWSMLIVGNLALSGPILSLYS